MLDQASLLVNVEGKLPLARLDYRSYRSYRRAATLLQHATTHEA